MINFHWIPRPDLTLLTSNLVIFKYSITLSSDKKTLIIIYILIKVSLKGFNKYLWWSWGYLILIFWIECYLIHNKNLPHYIIFLMTRRHSPPRSSCSLHLTPFWNQFINHQNQSKIFSNWKQSNLSRCTRFGFPQNCSLTLSAMFYSVWKRHTSELHFQIKFFVVTTSSKCSRLCYAMDCRVTWDTGNLSDGIPACDWSIRPSSCCHWL